VAALELPPGSRAALLEPYGKARLTRHRTWVHLAVEAIEEDDERLVRRELDLVAGDNVVVSVRDGPIEAVDRFPDEVRGNTSLGKLDAGTFLAALVDTVVATWFARIDEVEREIDRLDEIALRGRDSEVFLVEVLRLRRRIAFVRRAIAPHREAFAPLARLDFDIDERLGKPWPGLVDRLERVIDAIENARELLVGSVDIYLGSAAQRSNDVMKALTVLSAILLPGVVLAGIMGMNFKLPFFDEPNNFFIVLGGMGVFAIGLLVFARSRRWI